MSFFGQAVLVFIAVAIVDAFWTRYFQSTTEKQAVKAGYYSALIILFSAFTTRAYVHDGWMTIPAALGAFVGTWATVRYHKVSDEGDSKARETPVS